MIYEMSDKPLKKRKNEADKTLYSYMQKLQQRQKVSTSVSLRELCRLAEVDAFHRGNKSPLYTKLLIFNFRVNTLPNGKFSDWSNLKALADGKIKMTGKIKFFGEE